MAPEAKFILGRFIEITEPERLRLRDLAGEAKRLADDQSAGWFVPYGRLIFAQQRTITSILNRSHDDPMQLDLEDQIAASEKDYRKGVV